MELSQLFESKKRKHELKKRPVVVPWQCRACENEDERKFPPCGPSEEHKDKHKCARIGNEAKKARNIERKCEDERRRLPKIVFPSEDNVNNQEEPLLVAESDLQRSYYCKPPKISQSLIDLLDKHYGPEERTHHPSYLDLPVVKTEQKVKLTRTEGALLKTKWSAEIANEKKKTEDEMSKAMKARIQAFKRLKEGYTKEEKTYKCHYHERSAAGAKEKQEYVKFLADRFNCEVGLLESNADLLYSFHLGLKKQIAEKEKSYVENSLEWMERLMNEEEQKKKLAKGSDNFRNVSKKRELLPMELSKEIPTAEVEENEQLKIVQSLQLSKKEEQKDPESTKNKSKTSRRKSSRGSGRRSSSKRRSSRRKSVRKASKTGKKSSSSKKEKQKLKSSSRSSQKKPMPTNLEPYVEPVPNSVLDPLLVSMFGEWAKKKDQLDGLKFSPDSLPPTDTLYYTKPKSILINNFQPNVEYRKQVKLISRSKLRSYCRPHLIKMERNDDLGVLKIEPWTALSSPPGIHPVVTVVFSPLGLTRRIEADIIFVTRHGQKSWRSFSFHVSCIPPSPQISIDPVLFKFPSRKIWSKDVLVKRFTVVNKGAVPCTLFVRRGDSKGYCTGFEFEESEFLDEGNEDDAQVITINSLFCIYPTIKFKELKPKKLRDQTTFDSQDFENVDAIQNEDIVAYIVERLLEKVFENFTVNRKYDIEVPGRSRLRISVAFKPRFAPYVGTVHEQWCLTFTDFSDFYHTQAINLFAEIDTTPLYVKPLVLDMKLCLLNSGVQQQSFVVGNSGKRCHQLIVKLPPSMCNQATIHNPDPLILGGEEAKILVRLDLKYSFCSECSEYYDPETNILDFPVYISSKKEDETGPPLEIRVMAIVTRSMGLQIAPELIDYGVVNTYQSATFPIYLTNNSIATHRYGFLNLPKWAMIQPGYGFGVIGPGEKLRLDLIYSPTVEQVPWPGGVAEHFFILIVTTMDRLANHVPAHKLITTNHRHEVLLPKEYEEKEDDSPPPMIQTVESQDEVALAVKKVSKSFLQKESGQSKKESVASTRHAKKSKRRRSTPQKETEIEGELEEAPIKEDPFNFEFVIPNSDDLLKFYKQSSVCGIELQPNRAEDYLQSCEENMSVETADEREGGGSYRPCATMDPVFSLLAVRALVIDPHCELSAQKIVLPPTPFYSYSITPFYLKCPNMQSHKICYCGKGAKGIYKPPPSIKAKFEFFSNFPFIDVEPCSGYIRSGQELKLKILVRPRLSQNEILQRAKILKAIAERERLLNERQQRKSRKKSKKSTGVFSKKSKIPRKGSRRDSQRASKKVSAEKGHSASAKRKSATSKRKSATGKRKSATGKRKSATGKRKSAVGGKQKSKNDQEKSKTKGLDKKKMSKDQKLPGVSEEDGDIVVDPEQMHVDEADLLNSKLNLMRYKEPMEFEVKIDCLIETELEEPPYTRRKEQLELLLYGTLVRPDITVFTHSKLDQHIQFETTAVGMKRKLNFEVYNTSGRTILLNHSCFGASESFYVPLRLPLDQMRPNRFQMTGIWLDPDQLITLPVIFAPKSEKTVSEYIEMRSNSTVVPLKFEGRGVEPKFKITPQFLVGKLRSKTGAPVQLPIWIENQCDAELEFNLDQLYIKEGPMYDLDTGDEVPSSKLSKSRKSTARKSTARKSTARKSESKKSESRKVGSRKSMSSKSTSRKSVTGKKPSKKSSKDKELDEDATNVQKGGLKVEGKKNKKVPSSDKKKNSLALKSDNYNEVISGELVNLLKQDFHPVGEDKQKYMFRVVKQIILKPKESKKILVEFQPFKMAEPEKKIEQADKRQKVSNVSRKSLKRAATESEAPKIDALAVEPPKIDAPKSAARKSVARKSVARKSVARKSVARKSLARKTGGQKTAARKSVAGKSSTESKKKRREGSGASKKSVGKKINYIIDETMYGKTYASKVRLMLGPSTKVIDWWFMGQVFPDGKKPPSAKSTSKPMQ